MRRAALALSALFVLVVLVVLSPAAVADPGERKSYTKTFPFGPGRESKVGIRQGPVTIESVRIRNWPDADDFADAEKDLNETHTMVVEFEYSNRDEARDWKCRYTVTITGKDGSTWAENDRTANLDAGKIHDTNKMFVRMKTRFYKRATSYRVKFELWRN
ncbi:MAG: hypothetical protein ACYDBY_07285 [Thermoanaerobaculia bacterium]